MKFLYAHLLLLMLFIAGTVSAEELRYYDIEIIIFESLDEASKISESWRNEVSMEVPPLAVELGEPYPGPIPKEYDPKLSFKLLASNQLQLLEEAKLLTASKNYRILLHTAWRQPGMDSNTALPVHINQSFLETSAAAATPNGAMSPLGAPTSSVAASGEIQTRSILNGYIKIILSRYLHADINLMYTTKIPLATTMVAPVAQTDTQEMKPIPATQPTVYLLSQTRKMRSKELHYIDHPVLGVVILATPYEGPAR